MFSGKRPGRSEGIRLTVVQRECGYPLESMAGTTKALFPGSDQSRVSNSLPAESTEHAERLRTSLLKLIPANPARLDLKLAACYEVSAQTRGEMRRLEACWSGMAFLTKCHFHLKTGYYRKRFCLVWACFSVCLGRYLSDE